MTRPSSARGSGPGRHRRGTNSLHRCIICGLIGRIGRVLGQQVRPEPYTGCEVRCRNEGACQSRANPTVIEVAGEDHPAAAPDRAIVLPVL
jgi:hypothetical protein